MTVVIDKKLSIKEIKLVLKNLVDSRKPKSLKKHFGLSKEKIDAIEFQKKVRDEWS